MQRSNEEEAEVGAKEIEGHLSHHHHDTNAVHQYLTVLFGLSTTQYALLVGGGGGGGRKEGGESVSETKREIESRCAMQNGVGKRTSCACCRPGRL